MNNGKHESADSGKIIALLTKNNALLIEQIEHLVSVKSALEIVMTYLPACRSAEKVDKQEVERLGRAYIQIDKRNRKSSNQRLKKLDS